MDISLHISDPAALLAMPVPLLAGSVLEKMHEENDQRGFHPGNFSSSENLRGYPQEQRQACALALAEAWSYLVVEGLLVLRPGDQNNWHVLSHLGRSLKSRKDFESYLHARMFPRQSMHPVLAESIYPLFLAGDYETCIFKAFKAIEVAVRDAAGPEFASQYGLALMQQAFNPKAGPLSNPTEPNAEQVALINLFAGANGRFKHTTIQRHVPVPDPR